MTDQEIKSLRHPSERSRFLLALIAAVPLTIIGVVVVVKFIAALFVIPVIIGAAWFATGLLRARFVANTVRVSEINFPEIYHALLDAKTELRYPRPVEVFVYAQGEVNAFLVSLFRRNFILIPSGIVSQAAAETDSEIKWLISRFIGALKSKRERIRLLEYMISISENLFFLNLLLYPYERAAQYSGDQIGLSVGQDLTAAMRVMGKFFVGKDLADRIHVRGLLEQARETDTSVFAMIVRLLSPFPHLTSRYMNALSFARARYPQLFNDYMTRFDEMTRREILSMLSDIHEARGQSMPVPRPARASPGQAAKAQIGKIRILDGALAGMEVPVSAKVILGRDPTKAQIVFPSEDISVSRQHCEIQFDSAVASFAVRDLGSRNGTFIANGANPPRRLAPNAVERVALGKNILVGSSRNRLVLELG